MIRSGPFQKFVQNEKSTGAYDGQKLLSPGGLRCCTWSRWLGRCSSSGTRGKTPACTTAALNSGSRMNRGNVSKYA